MTALQTAALWVFWASLAGIAYTYFLYPGLLFCCYALAQLGRDWQYLNRRGDRRVQNLAASDLPGVTFITAAYNEEAALPAKLQNLAALDYPREKLEIVFISDASTDRTNEILSAAPGVRLIVLPRRGGKSSALNVAVTQAANEILVLSDAQTLFAPDALRALVRHFSNTQVGAVCGALRFEASAESRQTEGIYWKYESMLRLMEARLGVALTASGAIYALRRSAFVAFPPGTLIEDLLAPMNVQRQGLRVVYDPEAVATDVAAENVGGEFRRRVRIALGSFRALRQVLGLHLPLRVWIAFFSHKLLRWLVGHFAVALLISNLFLLGHRFYMVTLLFHLVFLGWAAIGFCWRDRLRHVRFALLGYFLFAMNLAFLVGFVRSFSAGKEGAWQRIS